MRASLFERIDRTLAKFQRTLGHGVPIDIAQHTLRNKVTTTADVKEFERQSQADIEFNLCLHRLLLLVIGDLLLLLPEALSTFDTATRIHPPRLAAAGREGEENQVERRFVNHASRKEGTKHDPGSLTQFF